MVSAETTQEIRRRVAIDLDACIECRSCAAACFYGHDELPIVNFARVGAAMLPAVCRQCIDAPCVAACPAEAMHRDGRGVVRRATLRCRGCGSCVQACPFGMMPPEMSHGEVAKCDLCVDLLAEGREPRCVATCTSGALHFVEEAEAQALGLLVLGSRALGEHPIRRR
jgi:Fe-S-cluster-containing dehydrogenase component